MRSMFLPPARCCCYSCTATVPQFLITRVSLASKATLTIFKPRSTPHHWAFGLSRLLIITPPRQLSFLPLFRRGPRCQGNGRLSAEPQHRWELTLPIQSRSAQRAKTNHRTSTVAAVTATAAICCCCCHDDGISRNSSRCDCGVGKTHILLCEMIFSALAAGKVAAAAAAATAVFVADGICKQETAA